MIFHAEKSKYLEFVSQVDGTPSRFSLNSSQVPFYNKISYFRAITIDFRKKYIFNRSIKPNNIDRDKEKTFRNINQNNIDFYLLFGSKKYLSEMFVDLFQFD